MTNTVQRPIVKTSNPELYAEHTAHMSKATRYTYNYSVLDDYILENYSNMTRKEIATNLNEYLSRVSYRVTKLQSLNIIPIKCPNLSREGRLKAEYIQSWSKANDLYKELMSINPNALTLVLQGP
ncbi:MAG: hypothetical protein CMF96_07060 [Candidatus Marinimicrobia bacterium]|nr:hypothetical protein [Candidatus Neomarinimicrobiota bacterium]|tara:strand:+ start:203 stop:577 length:375 start_codon:yes stop_codon:yes gene_type:complete